MDLYAFELGRMKELCFEELVSVLGQKNLVERNLDSAVFRLSKVENPQDLQDRLGGTIKIVKIFEELPSSEIGKLKKSLQLFLEPFFAEHSGKIPFSVSLLSFRNLKSINIKELLNFSKKILKNLGLNSRFVNKNFRSPKPSTIFKAKVVEKGVDINVINGKKKILLGYTLAVQNISAYSKRDYDKPVRDMKVGMTPPKLAQIMINLAGPDTKTIYDPFCGMGTYLMEGMLMGKNVIGSDIEDKMVEASNKNCEWLRKSFKYDSNFEVFERDARFLTKEILKKHSKEHIDAIVTEGYLGPPLEKFPNPHEQEVTFRELGNLHLNWLKVVKESTNCPIIMCIAAFRDRNGKIIHMPKFKQIAETAGYKIEKLFTYSRPDQVVVRDIAILK